MDSLIASRFASRFAPRFVPQSEASTDSVPPAQRLDFWESRNAAELVGLRCSTFAAEGLRARKRHFDLGSLRLCDIRGNEHVIERPLPMLRSHPKDSLFAGVLLQGEAFFYQSGRCIPVHQGDLIIYPTTLPYLYGFTGDMRQIQVDVSAEEFLAERRIRRPDAPLRIDASLPAGRVLARALASALTDFVDNPLAERAEPAAEQIRDLLEALLGPHHGTRSSSESSTVRLLRAEAFISEHLGDPALDAAAVARHLNLSVRHLNRLFALKSTTATHRIWQQRLERAHRELGDGGASGASIGDVALRWGFSTQAHFASSFKATFGITPSQHRKSKVSSHKGTTLRNNRCSPQP